MKTLMQISVLTLGLCLLIATSHASPPKNLSDSQVLSCAGIAVSEDADKTPIGISATFQDRRDSSGEGRLEIISVVYQSKLFQGSNTNSSGDFADNAPLTLRNITNTKLKLFEGAFSIKLDDSGEVPAYQLELAGKITTDPKTNSTPKNYFQIKTTLSCKDLST